MATDKFDAVRLVAQTIVKQFSNAESYTEHAITNVSTDGSAWRIEYEFPFNYLETVHGKSKGIKSVQTIVIRVHGIETSREEY